ncbi:MAG: T9SS type A sorting domain-containing protein [Bacteroidota bacterium]
MKKILISILLTSFCLTSHAQFVHLFDYNDFETPDSLLQIDISLTGNIWQIGTPSKIFFDSAYSIPKAIVTDTMNFYPPNNFSAFTIKISDPAWNPAYQPNRTSITFHHKYDTDSLQDGGYIEVSYDSGATWTNIVNDPLITGFNYNINTSSNPIIANGNAAYTGRSIGFSNGWRQDGFMWCYMPWLTPKKIFVRFVFSSDGIQTNKEGWMIDDIQLNSDICEGIPEIQNDNLITISPNPTSDELRIHRTSFSEKPRIQILNYLGQVLFGNPNFIGETIDTRNLQNGIYLLKYSDMKYFAIKKFIILH